MHHRQEFLLREPEEEVLMTSGQLPGEIVHIIEPE
jgi:hypothetical protein